MVASSVVDVTNHIALSSSLFIAVVGEVGSEVNFGYIGSGGWGALEVPHFPLPPPLSLLVTRQYPQASPAWEGVS